MNSEGKMDAARKRMGVAGAISGFAFLLAVLAHAPQAATQTPREKLTLALDWFLNPNHAPIVVAQESGFFAEAGLDVEIIAPANPADPPKLAAAGKVDLALSYQPQLHLQVAAALPLARVGTLIATPLNCLMVRADSAILSPAGLRGKRIGYSVAGVDEALVAAMLESVGLSLTDVEMVNVNWSLAPSLMAGQVDAVTGALRNFEPVQMRLEGVEGRCLPVEEHGIPVYDELIFVANPDLVDRERIARFLAAIERATLAIINDPEGSWRTFVTADPALGDALNRQAWDETLPRFALRPAAADYGRYRRFGAFLAARGLIEKPGDPRDYLMDVGKP